MALRLLILGVVYYLPFTRKISIENSPDL